MYPAANTTYNPLLLLIARVLIATLFLLFAIRSILTFSGSVGYFTKLGFPAPEAMVVIAIIIQLVAGVLLVIGWQVRRAAWLLILYVLIATFMAHRYWEYDAAQYANQMAHFFKNLALIGGLMIITAFGSGSMSVDKH
jgi:putative oxidoreductase